MKDKIKEVIRNTMPSYTNETETAQAILDLIAKELPKDGDDDFEIMAHEYYKQGFRDCLKDIKHKLEVTDG